MKKPNRLWSVVFLLTLLIPGYALGAATFTFEHPATVTLGEAFNLSVYLSADSSPPPTNVHGYSYCFNYDQTKIQLEPTEIPCCPVPVTDPVDGQFFRRTYADNCTSQDFPMAANCCDTCSSPCSLPDPGSIQFDDLAGFNPGEPPECVCAKSAPFAPTLVSTYTFRAIGPGTVQFVTNPDCTFIVSCDDTQTTPTVNNPPIFIRAAIPALSNWGMGIFALLMAGSFIIIMKRYRRSRKNMSALLVLLALGVTLTCGGLSFPQFALAGSGCPDECKPPVKLDLNNDGLVNIVDVSILSKCVKSNCADPTLDVNGDGQINQADYQALVDCMKKGCTKAQ